MSNTVPVYMVSCIDYRFDSKDDPYFLSIGKSYYNCSTAGASLASGYSKYCLKSCCNKGCDYENSSMALLKNNTNENLTIARTLQPINEIYFMNHQDCGAIKAFLACSGYPKVLGEDNKKEIKVQTKLLKYSASYMKKKFSEITSIKLGLIDINGSVAIYDINSKTWIVEYVGLENDKRGLWYGLKKGDIYKM